MESNNLGLERKLSVNLLSQKSERYISSKHFNKTLLASTIFLAVNSASAADACDYSANQTEVGCVQQGNQLNIKIHSDITNQPAVNPAAYQYEVNSSAVVDKVVIEQDANTTIISDTLGIKASGHFGSQTEIEVSTSGKIITGLTTDIDAQDPQPPFDGPSGGIIYNKTDVRETQQASVYLSGSSGGVLALGAVIQNANSEIINQSASRDTAAVYSKALESRITTSGIIRSSVGDAIRLEGTDPDYAYTSGGYIIIDPEGTFDVHLQASSVVEGGSEGAAIKTTGGVDSTITIEQGATIGALSDVAIDVAGFDFYHPNYQSWPSTVDTTHYIGAKTNISNAGTMTGVIQLSSGQDTVTNEASGIWHVRQWYDSDRDGIRDTVANIATSDFGGGTTTLINHGKIVLSAHPDNTTAVTALFDNLHQFRNLGTIQLTNGVTGDQLIINGNFIGEGGTISLDTHLGDDNSLTDKVVINGTTSGTTLLAINTTGGQGALTTANGIQVIEVNGSSDADSFTLAHLVKEGIYEYTLHQGSADVSDQSWYLRSSESPIDPENPVDPNENQINPDLASYLGNQTAATKVFMHTLHDRLGEPQFAERYQTDTVQPSVWVRAKAANSKNKVIKGAFNQDNQSYVVHLGGDIAQWTNDNNSRFHLGVMGAYGRSETLSRSHLTGSRVKGHFDGYGAGFYFTWYDNAAAPEGWYADVWSMYSWFDNHTEGKDSYKSRVWNSSLELGYALKLSEGQKWQWMLEPQLQVAYARYTADSFTDTNNVHVSDPDANGITTRLGGRLYLRDSQNIMNAQPFIEVNWLHNDAKNSLKFNGNKFSDDTPKHYFETKVGVQGTITKNFEIYSHIGLQKGQNGYKGSEGQLGIKFRF